MLKMLNLTQTEILYEVFYTLQQSTPSKI